MKVQTHTSNAFNQISSLCKEKVHHAKHLDSEQRELKNQFHPVAFVELKKANQQIAKLQSLGISFAQIQKELGELQDLNSQINRNLDNPKIVQKIKALQAKLDPLLREGKHYENLVLPQKISLNQKDEADKSFKLIQNTIKDALRKQEDKIEDFFASHQECGLDPKMLKDERFKWAHNERLLSSSFRDLIA